MCASLKKDSYNGMVYCLLSRLFAYSVVGNQQCYHLII